MSEYAPAPDANFPKTERFPRQMSFILTDNHGDPELPRSDLHLLAAQPNPFPYGPISVQTAKGIKVQGFNIGQRIGDQLTDNAYVKDNNRLHDGWHLAFMTSLGLSPVMRSHLGLKRRSDVLVDEIEDGSRAIIAEEMAVAFAALQYRTALRTGRNRLAIHHAARMMRDLLQPVLPPDSPLVQDTGPWRRAIALGHQTMEQLIDILDNGSDDQPQVRHAYLTCDLDTKHLDVSPQPPSSLNPA